MIVIHQKEENRGSFIAMEDDKQAGDMTYVWAGNDKIIADHTGVNPEFSGKGVGKKMLMEMVKFAREEKIKIIPLCPFVKSMFDKLEEIRDVL